MSIEVRSIAVTASVQENWDSDYDVKIFHHPDEDCLHLTQSDNSLTFPDLASLKSLIELYEKATR